MIRGTAMSNRTVLIQSCPAGSNSRFSCDSSVHPPKSKFCHLLSPAASVSMWTTSARLRQSSENARRTLMTRIAW